MAVVAEKIDQLEVDEHVATALTDEECARFLAELQRVGRVRQAAREAGVKRHTVLLRQRRDAEFAAAVRELRGSAVTRILVDACREFAFAVSLEREEELEPTADAVLQAAVQFVSYRTGRALHVARDRNRHATTLRGHVRRLSRACNELHDAFVACANANGNGDEIDLIINGVLSEIPIRDDQVCESSREEILAARKRLASARLAWAREIVAAGRLVDPSDPEVQMHLDDVLNEDWAKQLVEDGTDDAVASFLAEYGIEAVTR